MKNIILLFILMCIFGAIFGQDTLIVDGNNFRFVTRSYDVNGGYVERATKPMDTTEIANYFYEKLNDMYTAQDQSYIDSIYRKRDIRENKQFLNVIGIDYFDISNEQYKDYYLGDYFIKYNDKEYDCKIDTNRQGYVILVITDTTFVTDQYVTDDRGRIFFWSDISIELRRLFSTNVKIYNQTSWRTGDIPFLDSNPQNNSILNRYRPVGFIGRFEDGTRFVIRKQKKEI